MVSEHKSILATRERKINLEKMAEARQDETKKKNQGERLTNLENEVCEINKSMQGLEKS